MWNKTTGTIRNMGRKIELSCKGNVHGTISLPPPLPRTPPRTSPKRKMSGGPGCLCRMGTPLSLVKLLNHPPPIPISFALHNPPESIKYIFKSQIKDSVLLIIEPKRLAVDRATVCGLGASLSFGAFCATAGKECKASQAAMLMRCKSNLLHKCQEREQSESPTKCSNLSISGQGTDGG